MDFSAQWIVLPLIIASGAVEVLGIGGMFIYAIVSWLRPGHSRASGM
jgi:hypothetical protein